MTRGGVRTEQIWFNFEPGLSHWVSHVGRNFTDRQRIRRKVTRWRTNYQAMPPTERQAILVELLAAESELTGRLTRKPRDIAILCCEKRSYYKRLAGLDCYDQARDARTFEGGMPVICHPPCRGWSNTLSHLARPEPGEKELGLLCAEWLRREGGVLEHPAHSRLFAAAGLPRPGDPLSPDGLFTIAAPQCLWGYPMLKPTWFCFSRLTPAQVQPPSRDIPENLPNSQIFQSMTSRQRSQTTPELCHWLVGLVRQVCQP